MSDDLLSVSEVDVSYGDAQVLWDISLTVGASEVIGLIGPNGAGKTTLLKALLGGVPVRRGRIVLAGQRIDGWRTERIVALGLATVPEGRRVFPRLTVTENLLVGAYRRRDRAGVQGDLEVVSDLFPMLREKRKTPAGNLSGGQQQMVAIGRALMSRPQLVLMDEPSLGLAPIVVNQIIEHVEQISTSMGTAVLLVEQNARVALKAAARVHVISAGRIVASGSPAEFADEDALAAAYWDTGAPRA